MVAQIGQALLERQEAYRIKTEKELEGLRLHVRRIQLIRPPARLEGLTAPSSTISQR